jgi:hypothetical protein
LFDRLGDVQCDPQPPASRHIVGADGRREHDDRRRLEAAIGHYPFGQGEAVGSRHLTVDNRQRERPVRAMCLFECLQRFVGGGHHRRLHPPVEQDLLENPAIGRVVVDGEHRQRTQIGGLAARRVGSLATEPRGEMKGAADTHFAVEPHRAAHQRHEFRGNRQPEAGAAERPRG